jgi:hypothetical protein
LTLIAEALDEVGLEAILVGNAAAALQGAPVTTLDFDFIIASKRKLGRPKDLAVLDILEKTAHEQKSKQEKKA